MNIPLYFKIITIEGRDAQENAMFIPTKKISLTKFTWKMCEMLA